MPNAVKLKTFQGWNLDHVYGVDKTEKDGVMMVDKIYCLVCQKQLDKFLRNQSLKGVAQKEAAKYATPVLCYCTVMIF